MDLNPPAAASTFKHRLATAALLLALSALAAQAQSGAPPWIRGPASASTPSMSPIVLQFEIGDPDTQPSGLSAKVWSKTNPALVPNNPEYLKLEFTPPGTNDLAVVKVAVTVRPADDLWGEAVLLLTASDGFATTDYEIHLTVTNSGLRPARGMAGWWAGDGNARDAMGLNDGALANGAGFAPGLLAGAFSLDGEDDSVELPCPPYTGALGFSHTVETWVCPMKMADGTTTVFTKGDAGFPPVLELALVTNGLGGMVFGLSLDLRTNFATFTATTPVPLNAWSHVAVALGYGFKLYLNGELELEQTDLLWTFGDYGHPWWLSKGQFAPFQGLIDEFASYRATLTQEEIKTIYAVGKAGQPQPPRIIRQPSDVFSGVGGVATFSIGVANVGAVPVEYQWQFNSTNNLPGETNSTLTLTDLKLNQTGSYRVLVRSSLAELTSAEANLAVAGVMAWGTRNYYGELDVPKYLMGVVGIAAGRNRNLALLEEGTLVSWGSWVVGGTSFWPVEGGWSNLLSMSTDGGATYLVSKSDRVQVLDDFGVPEYIPPTVTNLVSLAANGLRRIALRTDGTVVCWGNINNVDSVPGDVTNVVAVSAGMNNFMALRADGTVAVWSERGSSYVPPGLSNIVAISAGGYHSMALTADGVVTVWCSGCVFDPAPVEATNIVAIAAGHDFCLALRADGSVFQWGMQYSAWPARRLEYPNAVSIAAGDSHALVLLRDGAPQMAVQPWDRRIFPGANQTFVAKAVGKLSVRYQWSFNDQSIPGATNETYVVENAQARDEGYYSLTASNHLGTVVSRKARLSVAALALSLPQPRDWTVNAGQTVAFTNSALHNNPARTLQYTTGAAPVGARLGTGDGAFSWRPPVSYAGTSNYVEITVRDDGSPQLSDTKGFSIWVAPLKPVTLTPVSFVQGNYIFQVSGSVGPDYVVQTSTDLRNWSVLETRTPSEETWEFQDPANRSSGCRYYRVLLAP